MKIGNFGDAHTTARTPSGRLDNYPVTCLKKFMEMGRTFQQEQVDIVISNGDLFNTPKVSNKFAGLLAEVIRSWGIPVYVVPGNHDIYGYNINTLDQTTLGLLAKTGVVTILTRDNPLTLNTDVGKVNIEGQEYYEHIDTGNLDDYDMRYGMNADYNVLVAHGMLLEKPYHKGTNYTLIKDVANTTRADMVIAGHYHPGWGEIIDNNVVFYNSGSILRPETCNREPKYSVIELLDTPTGIVENIREFSFTCTELANKVFDLTKNVVIKNQQQLIAQFKQSLQNTNALSNAITIPDMVNAISKAMSIDPNITSYTQQLIATAQSTTEDANLSIQGYIEKPTMISIDLVVLHNFQSHEHSEIQLTKGMNAFIGESNQGKTAIFRGICWALYNEPKGADFIRVGENSCYVEVYFSDGSIIKRERTKTGSGSYTVTDANGDVQTYQGFANNIPIEVANTHQMPKVNLTKDIEANLSVAYQLDPAFMLGESGANKATIIGRIIGVEAVDTCIKQVNSIIRNAQVSIKTLDKELVDLDNQLSAYNDLEDMDNMIKVLDFLISNAEKIEADIEKAKSFDAQLLQCRKDIQVTEDEINNLPDVEQYESDIESCSELLNLITLLADILDKYILSRNKVYSAETIMSFIPDESEYQPLIEQAETLLKGIAKANEFRTDRVKLYREIQVEETYLNSLPDMDSIDNDLSEADLLIAKIHCAKDFLEDLVLIQSDISKAEADVGVIDQDLSSFLKDQEDIEKEFEDYLKKNKVCVVCGSKLDKKHIDHIIKRGV